MKAKATKVFYDREKECYHKKNETFEVKKERLEKLISAGVAEDASAEGKRAAQ